ncbi:MAG: NUDIX hydrolase [Myxococcaceae bacterium]
MKQVVELEVVEDFTSSAKCDEGFLHVRRLRCRNRRADGSTSPIFRVDVVDRPRLDAVAVLVFREGAKGKEVLLRQNLRPAAYFRKDKTPVVPDGTKHLFVEEIVAGLLELEDKGEEGLRNRSAAEVYEEGGFKVSPGEVQLLGAPFFLAPGILSEKIFLAAVDVTGRTPSAPEGDGSPMEEGGQTRFVPILEALAMCRRGQIQDAKTELALTRLLAQDNGP